MRASDQIYLFDSLDSKIPRSSRKVHIRRVVDILQLSIHQRDWPRAKRAWSILERCPEFDWKNMWRTGLLLIQCTDSAAEPSSGKGLEYLRLMMLRSPENVSHSSGSSVYSCHHLEFFLEGGHSARNCTVAHKEWSTSRRLGRT